ncbi:CvpA family protein [Listeria seeligeri]|uniref:CvpA family protein n=1 Tax=Listeria seeligeri TaxID=1640 RepID=UPI001624F4DA|nr:CvpA family protein [Listeria seeligeri]MBC2018657.1 CvpA family protein [Listeria seeligeri]
MILNAIILIILVCSFFAGFRAGLIKQLILLVGYILAFFVSYTYYEDLAPHLTFIPYPNVDSTSGLSAILQELRTETAYYNVLAFVIIFIVAIIIVHMLASLAGGLTKIPILRQINGLLAAVIGVINTYLFIFVALFIMAVYPATWTENVLHSSSIAQWILENTPILSMQFYDWMTDILPK